jgi:hypothetical protein
MISGNLVVQAKELIEEIVEKVDSAEVIAGQIAGIIQGNRI